MRDLSLPGRSPVHAPKGMAATSHPLASQVAIDMLKAGGNAMDAAIAACATQCVVEPQSTGIGGDCFALYAPAGGEVIGYNGSGRAPAAADPAFFAGLGLTAIPRNSPHAVTIPGAIEAWCRLLADHGRMSLADVLAPAISYAAEGFPVSSRVHRDFVAQRAILERDATAARTYLPGGQVPRVGQMLRQPGLAATLRAIAESGADAFYRGPIAEEMVAHLTSLGGVQSMADFAASQGAYVTPISTGFRGYTVHECPPNGQGVIALLLLNMTRPEDAGDAGPVSADRLHWEIEACRLAYRARNMYLADPDVSNVPVEALLSAEYAARMRAAIHPDRAQEPPADIPLTPHNDTAYIAVVDKDRNACSFINTLFDGFGSGLMTPRSGVVFHNRGQGFSLDPGHPNCIAGGKRPLHTIIPGMLSRDDRAVMPFGVMGGAYQAMGHMQFLTRLLDDGLDIQEAMDAPRCMVDLSDGSVEIEGAVPEAIREALTARGHRLRIPDRPIGGSQAVWIDWEEGVLTGGSDPRKDGCAIGY